jgi:putative toxin-antitoxin system antitoxin component (TIGR02293 family)
MKAFASNLDLVAARPRPSAKAGPRRLVELRPGMVSFASAERLGERLGVSAVDLLEAIGIAPRTAARRRQEGTLKLDEADRLLRLARIIEEADRVFGRPSKTNLWLRAPHPLLGDSAPLTLLDSDAGAQAVSEELVRIEFGDFS